jgi:RNA polymerase sigma factor (sigma-70 family)
LRSIAVSDDAGGLREIRTTTYDIAERKRSEQALAKVGRALRALNKVRGEIIHAQSEAGLLEAVCHILVEQGGYRMACVHYAQPDSRSTMKMVAKAGFADREYENAKITWAADTEYGRGLIGRAVRSGQPQTSQHLLRDAAAAPWRDLLERGGYQSAVALPLRDYAGVFATLLVCAGEPAAFEREESDLLRELADDLSFGIGSLLAKAFAEEHATLKGEERDSGEDVLSRLSRREREVLTLVVEGYSSKEIAAELGVSPASVDTYRSRLMFKLGTGDLASLVRLAVRVGIVPA